MSILNIDSECTLYRKCVAGSRRLSSPCITLSRLIRRRQCFSPLSFTTSYDTRYVKGESPCAMQPHRMPIFRYPLAGRNGVHIYHTGPLPIIINESQVALSVQFQREDIPNASFRCAVMCTRSRKGRKINPTLQRMNVVNASRVCSKCGRAKV